MKTPVVLRLFKEDGIVIPVILFPTLPYFSNPYPEYILCCHNQYFNDKYSSAKLSHVMNNSTSIRPQDMEDLLQEVRKDYDIQVIEGSFEVGGVTWNT